MQAHDKYALPLYPALPLLVPPHEQANLIWSPDPARLNGIHIMGGPGSGKSRIMGRQIAWLDFLRGIPQLIIDPTGATIDNFLDTLVQLQRWYLEQIATWPLAQQQQFMERLPTYMRQLWERVVYVNMSGKGYITPFPLYHRHTEDETLFVTAQRFLDVVRRLDVALQDAPIEGFNALYKVGTYAGMIVTALGLQITEMEDLLRHPDRWKHRFEQALAAFPEVRPAIEFFRDFATKPELRTRRSDAFLTKILAFTADARMAAMFGATTPGLDWTQVVTKRQIVLLDFRGEHVFELRRFKLLWCFLDLLTFIKQRGIAGRRQPFGLMIDEITQLLGFRANEQAVMAADIEELVSVIARNYGVWLTIAHQNLLQVDERIQNALMQMGTQVIGAISNPDDALYLAKQFLTYHPDSVKKFERVWMNVTTSNPKSLYPSTYSVPTVIDHRTVEFTPQEQYILLADQFKNLGRFQFLIRCANAEGNIANVLQKMSIATLNPQLFPNDELMAKVRERLNKSTGIPIATIQTEIERRRRGTNTPPQPKNRDVILTPRGTNGQDKTDSRLPTGIKPSDFWQ